MLDFRQFSEIEYAELSEVQYISFQEQLLSASNTVHSEVTYPEITVFNDIVLEQPVIDRITAINPYGSTVEYSNGSQICTYPFTPMSIQWEAVDDAEYYIVHISQSSEFTGPTLTALKISADDAIVDGTTLGITVYLGTTFKSNSQYYIRIFALNTTGGISPKSEVFNFSFSCSPTENSPEESSEESSESSSSEEPLQRPLYFKRVGAPSTSNGYQWSYTGSVYLTYDAAYADSPYLTSVTAVNIFEAGNTTEEQAGYEITPIEEATCGDVIGILPIASTSICPIYEWDSGGSCVFFAQNIPDVQS